LLVVVAILGILAALTFPAINAAKGAGKNAACVSNLKQIGVALFSYVADHDGAFPPGSVVPSPDRSYVTPYLWFQALEDEYMGGNSKKGFSTNHPSWQECPAKTFKSWDRWSVGYGWNYWAGTYTGGVGDGGFGYDPAHAPGYGYNSRLAQVTHPSKTIIVGDSMDLPNSSGTYQNIYVYPPVGVSTPSKFRASRHGGKGNYLMVDGHVEALPPTLDISYFKKIK